MYERILIPTDGSEYADAAAETGFDLAETMDADVFVISVVETGPLGSLRLPNDPRSAEEALTERARAFVSQLAERASDRGIDVTTEIRQGIPVDEILNYTDEISVDLVVMGTRGRGGIDRMVLGSVADGVTRYSERDVLVVGGRTTEP